LFVTGMSRAATRLLPALLVAGVGMVVAAAPSSSVEGDAVNRGGTLRSVYLLPSGADPQAGDFGILRLTQLPLYMSAVVKRRAQLRPVAAAEFPSRSEDGKTFTITVRRGFRFSDGTAVTARNFAFAINRLFNPRLGSRWSYLFDDIVGARDVLEGKAEAVSGVTVRGRKLIIRLEQPRPDLVVRLTNPTISATPLDMPIVPGGVTTPIPSAGPYHLQLHVEGRLAVFTRNPFWRRKLMPELKANVDRILLERPGLTPKEAIEAVERDEIDLALAQFAPGEIPRLVSRYGVNRNRLLVRPRLTLFSLVFNLDRPLFSGNAKLRRAINYALDRQEMVDKFGLEVGTVTDQILPPKMPGYRNWKLYPLKRPNLTKARALARGNLRDAKAALYIRRPVAESFARPVAEVTKLNLAQIGLAVDIEEVPNLFQRLRTPGEPWDMALIGWYADYPDPFNFINDLFTGDENNFGHFKHVGFQRRMRKVARLVGRKRLAAYASLERDLMRRAAPIAPFLVVNDVIFVSPSLGCFAYDAAFGPDILAMCKK
jgi:ABC-type oligopeptide transport system substrate-binding subunit